MQLELLAIATLAVCILLKATAPDAQGKLKGVMPHEAAATGRQDTQPALTDATTYWQSGLKR